MRPEDALGETLGFDELARANRERCEARTFGHGLKDWDLPRWSNAIAGETGEMCNLVKKRDRGDHFTFHKGTEIALTLAAIGEELADIIIYSDLMAQAMGLNLAELVRAKFNKTSMEQKVEFRV